MGFHEAWKLAGKLPWKQLFQPTIDLCENGFPVSRSLAYNIQRRKDKIILFPNMKYMLFIRFINKLAKLILLKNQLKQKSMVDHESCQHLERVNEGRVSHSYFKH